MPGFKIVTFKCRVCRHAWYPRGPRRPKRCANATCRSMRWDKPGKKKGVR